MSDGVLSPSNISNYQRMKKNGFQSLMPLKLNTIKEIIPPERIYEMVKGSEIELPVLLAMWLSFSMSELQGLYKSKSLQGDYLVIADVEIMVNGKYVQKKQGKTYTRNRKHHVPEYLMNLIHEVKTDKIVTLSGQAIHHRFTRMLDNCQLPHMTFHDLRHINASVMSMLNIPDKYAQERSGWKTDRVMKKIYTHTFSSERVLVDQKIDAYFNGILGNETQPNLDKEKYKSWLTLFDKKDSKESLEAFRLFMQHEMQHE